MPVTVTVYEREAHHRPGQIAVAQRLLRRHLAGRICLARIDGVVLPARTRLIFVIDVARAGQNEARLRSVGLRRCKEVACPVEIALPDQRFILSAEHRREVDNC